MWKLTEAAGGKFTCDNYDLKSGDIPDVLKILEKEFNIQDTGRGAVTMDMTALDFFVDNREVVIGWDCWSGVFIMAKNKSENDVIERVYKWITDYENVGGQDEQ